MRNQHLKGIDFLYRLWQWWWGEVRQLIPLRAAGLFNRSGGLLRFNMEKQVTRLQFIKDGEEHLLAVCDLENLDEAELAELRQQYLSALSNRAPSENLRVEVLIPPERVLSQPFTLPLATEANLQSVLAFEIDRFTPFRTDQVCYSWQLLEKLPSKGKLRVLLHLVRRDYLDTLLAKLEALGLRASLMAPANAGASGGSHNLLPPELRPVAEPLWTPRNRNLMAVVVLLLLAVLIFPLYQAEHRIGQLRANIDGVQKQALAVSAKQAKLAAQVDAQDALVLRKNREPGKLLLIHQITRLLPDNTWVSRLEIGGGHISLQGESQKASDLIELLDQAPTFQNVAFASSITRNPTTDMERYEIRMALANSVPEVTPGE